MVDDGETFPTSRLLLTYLLLPPFSCSLPSPMLLSSLPICSSDSLSLPLSLLPFQSAHYCLDIFLSLLLILILSPTFLLSLHGAPPGRFTPSIPSSSPYQVSLLFRRPPAFISASSCTPEASPPVLPSPGYRPSTTHPSRFMSLSLSLSPRCHCLAGGRQMGVLCFISGPRNPACWLLFLHRLPAVAR